MTAAYFSSLRGFEAAEAKRGRGESKVTSAGLMVRFFLKGDVFKKSLRMFTSSCNTPMM